jgi:hypothetical protein
MSYLAIAAHCVEASRGRGFAPTTFETADVRLLGMHSEIIELRKAVEEDDQRAMSLEGADIAIYALVVMHDLGASNWTLRSRMHIGPPVHCEPATMVAPLHDYVNLAYRAWRDESRGDMLVSIELLLSQLLDLRTRVLRLPNSLPDDIAFKLAIDTGRPRLNGHLNARS